MYLLILIDPLDRRYLAKLTNCFSFIAIKPDGVQVWSI
jgi:hypothetical protein